MKEHMKRELEKILGLKIPDNATVDITIKGTGGELSRDQLASVTGGAGAAPADPTFKGQMTFSGGELSSMKAVDTSPQNVDYFKQGTMGPCW